MAIASAIKGVLGLDLRECRLSRAQVAEELSRLCGRVVTESQIDAYTAETKSHRFPAELVPAWVKVTGSVRLLSLLCGEAGMWLGSRTDHGFAEYGRAAVRREKESARLEQLKGDLWAKA